MVLATVLVTCAPSTASAQLLDRVSGAVHGSSGSSSSHSSYRAPRTYHTPTESRHSYRTYSSGYGSSGYEDTYRDPPDPNQRWLTLPYPFFDEYDGRRVQQGHVDPQRPVPDTVVLGIVTASAGYVFGDVMNGNLQGRLRLFGHVDIDLRYAGFFQFHAGMVSSLGIGRLGIAYTASSENFEYRVAIEPLFYHDLYGVEGGLDARNDFNFAWRPVVLDISGALGFAGNAWFLEAMGTFGIQIDRGQIFAGWQVLAFNPGNAAVTLQGPVIGARAWVD
jgi:hypothetical protein